VVREVITPIYALRILPVSSYLLMVSWIMMEELILKAKGKSVGAGD